MYSSLTYGKNDIVAEKCRHKFSNLPQNVNKSSKSLSTISSLLTFKISSKQGANNDFRMAAKSEIAQHPNSTF